MAKLRVALAHQRAATRVHGSAEHGHSEHWNAVTAHSRPSDQKHIAHEFKVSAKTKLLELKLNRLHYAKDGLLGYQPELKHDTTS